MTADYDLAVIGAGPAGLAAASLADELGLSVALLDEQAAPGGQIYRSIEQSPISDRAILGPDYYAGLDLVEKLRGSGVEYLDGAAVWQVHPAHVASHFAPFGVKADGGQFGRL